MTSTVTEKLNQLSSSEMVLLLREELKQLWKAGDRILVENLLVKWPQAKLLPDREMLDLIYQELVLREEKGEQPGLEEYQQRFPALTPLLQRQFALHQMLKTSGISGLAEPNDMTTTLKVTPMLLPEKSVGVGAKILHYYLEGELGRGGMGIVFKAQDEKLQRTVALKLLLGQELASADQLQRFRIEAEILAKLQHPNIVQVFDIGEHEGKSFFVMEYVAGNTLQIKVQENPLPPQEAARVVALLSDAMQTAHERGIIHRDLKPSNILMNTEKVPKITDFGLARQGRSELTAPGTIMGTPSYMAPEQAQGQQDRIGPATDVYSLGAILFELLTGRAPFRGATIPSTLHQVVHNDPPSPSRLQPGIPRDLETICLKCLQKDPAKRFVSAQALSDDLQRFLRGEPIRARPIGWLETLVKWAHREPKVAGLAATVILVALIGFVSVLYAWQAEKQARINTDYAWQAEKQARIATEEQLYFRDILQAERELATPGKLAWAKDSLAKWPGSMRGWEWYHLNYRSQLQAAADMKITDPKERIIVPASTEVEIPGAVSCLAAHPEKTSVVVGCANGRIVILDGEHMRAKPFFGHIGSVNWLTFDPDGKEFYSGGEDGRIESWNWATGEKIKTIADHQGPISCLALHPQEPWIASTTFDGPDSRSAIIWHRRTGERLLTMQNHQLPVTGLAFHPKGNLLATASYDKTITLWDCRTGEIRRVLRNHRLPVSCVAFSLDGSLLASSAGRLESVIPGEDEIFVWDTATGDVRHRLSGHTKRAVALAFAPGGKRLATAGWDKQVKLWDLQTGHQEVLTLVGHHDGIMSLAFDRQRSLYTGSLDQTVRIWKAPMDSNNIAE